MSMKGEVCTKENRCLYMEEYRCKTEIQFLIFILKAQLKNEMIKLEREEVNIKVYKNMITVI
jgi:hypothetical protein